MIPHDAKIMVTGANGLAGSAVVQHLRDCQFENVIPIARRDGDLRNPEAVFSIMGQHGPTYVFHAAATVYGIMGNMKNQAKSIYDNTLINTNIIEASRIARVKKLVVMGTNAVYPWPPQLPYREETIFDGRPHAAESAYGHAKRHMLAMLEAYHESYGMDYCYLVSGNLYGPRDKFDPVSGHVLPSLIWKFYEALINPLMPVEIWGDGTPSRDFLHSGDLARIVRATLDSDVSGAVNIGSGVSYTIREIVDHLCNITGISRDRIYWRTDMPNGRPDCRADLTNMRTRIGLSSVCPLAVGLTMTWGWYKNFRLTGAR